MFAFFPPKFIYFFFPAIALSANKCQKARINSEVFRAKIVSFLGDSVSLRASLRNWQAFSETPKKAFLCFVPYLHGC
jgi:hypothetical protein